MRITFSGLVPGFLREFSYSHGMMRVPSKPRIFQLETTNMCPFTCVMCPRTYSMTRSKGHMDFGLFKNILDQVRPAWQMEPDGRPLMRLMHYGEPTVYPLFAESIDYCHSRGFQVFISSNPSAWTQNRIEEMVDSGLDVLSAMVDGMDNETIKAIRGKNADFARTEENLRQLAELKVKKGRQKPFITVVMIKQQRNAHQWDQLESYWKKVSGIDKVSLGNFSTFGNDTEAIRSIESTLKEKDAVQQKYQAWLWHLQQYPCYYPWHSISVTWDGLVVPCCRDYNTSVVLGDLKKQSLNEVWNGKSLQELRNQMMSRNIMTPMCKACREPSLEIDLPGTFYPAARIMRALGTGKAWKRKG